ncbi:redoxin domain-containing protein [Paenibacillus periandrae]|uniref:redoxin domain-containing protein n=1 Tax=Paenibacillus periandrae TaxID=1761741 RepID=UPI001F09683E|nr:redoxin domain-containing protein [Paenibacillus periandrae]
MKEWRKWTTLVVIVVIGAALIYTLFQPQPKLAHSLKPGDPAPDFTSITLDGASIKLSDYRGKGVLLNFWASWCTPCVEEMPRMNKAYRLNTSNVEIIAVNVGESRGTAREFLTTLGIDFPVWLDPSGEAAQSYKVTGLPATFLIDKQGRLVKAVAGELPNDKIIVEHLKSIEP